MDNIISLTALSLILSSSSSSKALSQRRDCQLQLERASWTQSGCIMRISLLHFVPLGWEAFKACISTGTFHAHRIICYVCFMWYGMRVLCDSWCVILCDILCVFYVISNVCFMWYFMCDILCVMLCVFYVWYVTCVLWYVMCVLCDILCVLCDNLRVICYAWFYVCFMYSYHHVSE